MRKKNAKPQLQVTVSGALLITRLNEGYLTTDKAKANEQKAHTDIESLKKTFNDYVDANLYTLANALTPGNEFIFQFTVLQEKKE